MNKKYTSEELLKFLIPSLIGIFIFMIPIKYNGEITIPVAVFSQLILKIFGQYLTLIITVLISLGTLITVIAKLLKPKFILNNGFLNSLFNVTPFWFIARVLGMFFVIISYSGKGFEFIYSENTGNLVLNDLLPILFAVFLFAGLLLPLLLNFGLLEFCGALLSKVMRPLFKLPGRASIDCITSWLGDGTIGVLLTSKQYEEGFYTERESCVIGTAFSVVSITFCLVVISNVGLSHMFIPFYLTVTFAGIVAAFLMPRIGPLKNKPDTLYNDVKPKNKEEIPEGFTPFSYGVNQAVARAKISAHPKDLFIEGLKNVLDMWIGVIPIVMAMGTLALIVAEYTPIFQWLGMPFIPIFKLLHIPEAQLASQTVIVGFADMFLPSVMASKITSDMTRFVVACVSVTQLIYMSEVGSVILGSKIPLNIKELFILFLQRTLITLPVIAIIAHLLF